jgi:hypothetical protein
MCHQPRLASFAGFRYSAGVHAKRSRARLRAVARVTSYRQLAKSLKVATGDPRWSHVKLRRFEQHKGQLSAAELAQLDRALDASPIGRKRDRRLEKGVDDAREIVNARGPWVHYQREAAYYVEARDRMPSAERKRAWRRVDRRYRECGQRDASGRPTDPDYQLTLDQALYRLSHLAAQYVVGEPNEVTHRKRFVQRRIDARLVDDEPQPSNPRARVVLEQFRALRTSASPIVEHPFVELARAARWAHTVNHATTQACTRVPTAVIWALHAPGMWAPARLHAAGLTCWCTACARTWPAAEVWWREHNIAMQPKIRRRRAGSRHAREDRGGHRPRA